MEIHQVNAKQGLQWLLSGFYLFRRAPIPWVLICGALFLIAISAALIPFIGSFIFTMAYPALMGGIMQGCRALEEGKPLEITHLFSAAESNFAALITIGGIYLTGLILISGLAALIGGPAMTDMLLYGKRVDETQLMGVASSMLTSLLIVLTLSIPLMMASWFAPMLVVFHKMPPVMAMQQSLLGCLRNLIPLLLFLITSTILAIICALPYGAGLVILIPTMYAAMYASYKDIFLGEPIRFKDHETPDAPTRWHNTEDSPKKSEHDEKPVEDVIPQNNDSDTKSK
ncbi:uncharacterized membrane protein [Nitrosomonas sp. PY1]|uniref:BPSS1780 family membrane protein n=1 Tax=Nitrosomonas sp. PY1 TaxID=1803906 RepID=UPI001FC7DC84|nr:BPSS1780 family membrane protein [Nitrosomonas sp. PY1]GKS69218.1 uncharacterized membrane protein [Nitrosomonas sp. PY1]